MSAAGTDIDSRPTQPVEDLMRPLAAGQRTLSRGLEIGLAGLGFGLAAVIAWVALTGIRPGHASEAVVLALAVAVPLAVGLFAWDGTHARFARALVALGLFSFVPGLSSSGDATVYSIGRVGDWLITLAGIWLVLAFPSGRLRGRADHVLVGTAIAVAGVLYLPTIPLSESYPVPTQWTACVDDCPRNAFMLVHTQPEFLAAVVFPLRELLVIALFAAIPVRLALRIRGAPRLSRRTLTPVLVASICATVVLTVGLALRRHDPASPIVQALAAVLGLWIPAVSIGFLVAVVRWRFYVAGALQRLASTMGDRPEPEKVEALAAELLDDPRARLAQRDASGEWRDASGALLELGPDQELTAAGDAGGAVVAVVHDATLTHERSVAEAVAVYGLIADAHRRMAAEMQSALRELADTRAGLVATADAERRRIERDIHDGAQQRLVALGIRVSLADELVDRDPAQAHAMMRTLKDEIDQAVDELRSLAAGIYPAVLTDHGLAPALRELARHASRPVHVDVPATIGRFAPDVETTVYFACSEALQNVAKHAGDAAVSLTLSRSADLVFRVCDDGPGFDAARPTGGRGLANMRDRLTALGGTLTVVSTPGKGTCVGGRIPLRASTER